MDMHALEEAIQQVWGEWLTADFELRYAARSAAAQELVLGQFHLLQFPRETVRGTL